MLPALTALLGLVQALCVMRGDCGPVSRFGNSLPCVNYTDPAVLADKEARSTLQKLCGFDPHEAVCCEPSQVVDLATNLKRVEPIIGSCPACLQNFWDVFCQFTCSPRQAEFLNVTLNQTSFSGDIVPKSVDYFLDVGLASNFYNSCRDVKFSATNGRALDLIGGGAQNYSDFLQFLGDEKPMLGGSVFQIDFAWDSELAPVAPQNKTTPWQCGEGERKCSCIDCEMACPNLPDPPASLACKIGPFRCVSLALVLSYLTALIALAVFVLSRCRTNGFQAEEESAQLIDGADARDDPFALPSSELGSLNLRSYRLDAKVSSALGRLGEFCARYPSLMTALCALFVLCSSLGLVGMQIETDPIKLWVSPSSREAQERQFFNDEFGGFYRTAQMFVTNENGSAVLTSYDDLEWLKSVETRLSSLHSPVLQDSLSSFCLQPVNSACVVESVTQYGIGKSDRWREKLAKCAAQSVNCLPRFQQPIDPQLVFGGNTSNVLDSPALITTWVLNNSEEPIYLYRVKEWELMVEQFMRTIVITEAEERGLHVSFSVESSLERELARSGVSDVTIIVASYLLMFAYVALALGESPWIGLMGVLVVLCSVVSAVGLLSVAGFRLTLIITEVIPFLALAIGVDNIFLIVHQLNLVSESHPELVTIEDQVSGALASIGPSIVLSTSCEAAALAIAVLVPMPAVRNFALFACVSVLLNSVLQLTLFVAVLTMYKRHQQKLLLALVQTMPTPSVQGLGGTTNTAPRQMGRATSFQSGTGSVSVTPGGTIVPPPTLPQNIVVPPGQGSRSMSHSSIVSAVAAAAAAGRRQEDPRQFTLIFSYYTPWLLGRTVKQCVWCLFMLWLAVSLYVIPLLNLGLDQRQAVPTDSFLVPYFSDVYKYLDVGPPTYFVVVDDNEHHVEKRQMQQQLCSRFSACETASLTNVLEVERKRPETSWLATAPASWIDDFLTWLNPSLEQCCVDPKTGNTCYADKPWGFDMRGFPENKNFTRYLQRWLSQPSDQCPLAGRAPYGQALSLEPSSGEVRASFFRTNHVPLRSQNDYISAYTAARATADRLTSTLSFEVFPYSVFYPFFAQYLTIVSDSLRLVTAALAVTGLLAWLLLGNLRTALVLIGVVSSLVINVCGLMYFFGISLNALSLVNLVICVGLGVEFCIHIARSYTFVSRVHAIGIHGFGRVDRSYNALVGTGGTVFGGVAVTKLLGVGVLAFAHSQIFHVYYFRMWLALIVTATLHSLVLLPVALSTCAGGAWLVENEGGGLGDLEEL